MIKKAELEIIVKWTVYLTILACVINCLISGDISLESVIKSASYSLSISTLFWAFFLSTGWKFFPFKYLMYRPNLNGTWKGLMISDWTDENGQTVPPKTMYVVVRQKFLSINFTTHTETFIGNSYVETFLIDKERGTLKVVYLYMKDSTDHNLQPENQGVSELRVIDSTPKKMEGIFFTIIKSKGNLSLTHISTKHINTYSDAEALSVQN